MFSDKEQR
jgi:hypothetical protein